MTDEAINLINSHDIDTPYFLHMSHYAVHTPIQAKRKDIKRFRKKAKTMRLNKKKTFSLDEHFPCKGKKLFRVRRRLVQSNARYAAMIFNLDYNIGRLLDAIEESGQADNTVIVFTSDNGGLATAEGSPTCNAPLAEGKGWMYEGGVREPLIIKWTGKVKAGSECSTPVTSPDFYPTILDMANLPLIPEQHSDGESIVPLLKNDGELKREAIYWHYPHYANQGSTPGSSIRMGDYKLIEFFEDNRIELYNLREDLSEENDLSKVNPELAQNMRKKLSEWRNNVGALIPILK
ncbi:MAG: sulfatase-like hydrolase/transferase [Opitutales bacterium]|nr:sulfatase-like hydrolase/transferase [Opitutales bacterium]